MVQAQENRYNKKMVNKNILTKISIVVIMPFLLASCSTFNSIMNSDEESSSQIKDISLNKRLQISIPIPENSKYITDKTIIFGEGSRFTGVLYLIHEISADEVVEFYRVNMRDAGWSEIAIVRSDFILLNFDKEDKFATIKVNRKVFDNSSSEVTIGPKSDTTINRSINIDTTDNISSEEPFSIQ
jgi:hypothetical protein|tara:strand:+ start:402 stop:956 length:555 start_codon:yes stop_codon:yes gene_type:complete